MRFQMVVVHLVGVVVGIVHSSTARQPDSLEPILVKIDAKPHAVTLYQGRAAVTRRATLTLESGLYELQFDNLPESVQPSTLQARATGGANVLGVDFAAESSVDVRPAPVIALDEEILRLQSALSELEQQRGIIKAQEDFVNAVSIRAASDASAKAGESKLDLNEIRNQMKFIADEHARLLSERREIDAKQRDLAQQLQVAQAKRQATASSANVNRTANVMLTAPNAGQVTVELTYLVANATWEPTYNIRAQLDGSTAHIEYNALLTQRTSEDWENITLTLSTSHPMVAANPPTIQPWYVDVFRPDQQLARRSAEGIASLEEFQAKAPADALRDKLEGMAADATVYGGGPSVTFLLPRTVTVKTNVQKQQTTRIGTIDARPKFIHVAVPAMTEAVYIRGMLLNSSLFQLLPGRASIFVGQDYVGPTHIESVAPNGEFKVHFGIDNAVRAFRKLVSKNTENTGLLSGGRRTTYEYRLSIDNGTGKAIVLEMWDRHPVSRSSEIQVELLNLTDPLSNDAYYVAQERPQGLLKWILNVPATARDASAYILGYGITINRAKDIELSPLPE